MIFFTIYTSIISKSFSSFCFLIFLVKSNPVGQRTSVATQNTQAISPKQTPSRPLFASIVFPKIIAERPITKRIALLNLMCFGQIPQYTAMQRVNRIKVPQKRQLRFAYSGLTIDLQIMSVQRRYPVKSQKKLIISSLFIVSFILFGQKLKV